MGGQSSSALGEATPNFLVGGSPCQALGGAEKTDPRWTTDAKRQPRNHSLDAASIMIMLPRLAAARAASFAPAGVSPWPAGRASGANPL